MRCIHFHFHLLEVTVSCRNDCSDCTDTTADYKSVSSLVQNCCKSHPVVVQMYAVEVAWMLIGACASYKRRVADSHSQIR